MKVKSIIDFLDLRNVKYEFNGDKNIEILGYSSIFHYKEGTVSWLRDMETFKKNKLNYSNDFTCIITKDEIDRFEQTNAHIRVADPKDIFFEIINYFWGEKISREVSEKAIIEDGATVGENPSIGPFTYISNKTVIGNNCTIGANVIIKGKVDIGNDCVIQSGSVIGEDGFGFVKHENEIKFVKHLGGVTIGDHVNIGSQTCICRGSINNTYIGEYTKIDNLCHIAHNVEIGQRCIIIAGTIIMGSVHIGNDCWVSTSAIRDLSNIGDNCTVGMGSIVVKDVSSCTTVLGNPANQMKK